MSAHNTPNVGISPTMVVYGLFNTVTEKVYVGQTTRSLAARIKGHLNDKTMRCTAIAGSIKKHGPEAFLFFVIKCCSSIEELNVVEEKAIEEFQSVAPHGYNLRSGGQNKRHSEVSKLRMSETQKKVYQKRDFSNGYPNSGTKLTEAQKLKMSLSHMGKRQSAQHVRNRALSNSKMIECITTGEIFLSIGAAAAALKISRDTITRLLKNEENQIQVKPGYPSRGLRFRRI